MSMQSSEIRRESSTPTLDVPMQAQVYARLRNRLREVETLLEQSRADRLDENGEPRHVAERAVLESQAASLRAISKAAQVVPIGAHAIIGSTVHVSSAEGAAVERYEIVIPTEADPATRKVSFDSPIGAALLGRAVGDTAVVSTPRGDRHLRVMVIQHD
ncbi:MAG: GreA/GreB family elongation factor [Dehalococcoidia bacterium]|nr:GreA/GreB family elongation factor [Dehalococcoidia bacterium]